MVMSKFYLSFFQLRFRNHQTLKVFTAVVFAYSSIRERMADFNESLVCSISFQVEGLCRAELHILDMTLWCVFVPLSPQSLDSVYFNHCINIDFTKMTLYFCLSEPSICSVFSLICFSAHFSSFLTLM